MTTFSLHSWRRTRRVRWFFLLFGFLCALDLSPARSWAQGAANGDGGGDPGAKEVVSNIATDQNGGDTGESLFKRLDNLRYKIRGVGLIVLLIMGAVAGVMAAFGKTNMAMSVMIGAVIFFAVSWGIALVQNAMSSQ